MSLLSIVLLLSAFLCSLVAGLLFAFAIVIMPGIARLDDAGFLRAFQVIDRVIQQNQPVFMLVWVGSVLALVVAALLGAWQLRGGDRILVVVAALVYLFGVQLPTATINLPLNNQLQKLDTATMSESVLRRARSDFEPRWNRSNNIRTVAAGSVTLLLLVLLLRLNAT